MPPPDYGLKSVFELISFLGRGGSGDTWLYRNRESKELVAIKLIARPLPKALLPVQVEREIKVCQRSLTPPACCVAGPVHISQHYRSVRPPLAARNKLKLSP